MDPAIPFTGWICVRCKATLVQQDDPVILAYLKEEGIEHQYCPKCGPDIWHRRAILAKRTLELMRDIHLSALGCWPLELPATRPNDFANEVAMLRSVMKWANRIPGNERGPGPNAVREG